MGSHLRNTQSVRTVRTCLPVLEPFDEALAARVRSLSDSIDQVTEQVVARRRTVPTNYARAVARHSKALRELADAHEEQRRAGILRARKRPRFEAIAAERPIGDTEGCKRAADSLKESYSQLSRLPEVCAYCSQVTSRTCICSGRSAAAY